MAERAAGPTQITYVVQVLSGLLLASAWVVLGWGLWFTETDPWQVDELEAGGRFALNFAVYLPHVGLTLPVAAVAVTALIPRRWLLLPLGCTICVVAAFGLWVLANDSLRSARPDITGFTVLALCLDGAALAGVLVAAVTRSAGDEPARPSVTP